MIGAAIRPIIPPRVSFVMALTIFSKDASIFSKVFKILPKVDNCNLARLSSSLSFSVPPIPSGANPIALTIVENTVGSFVSSLFVFSTFSETAFSISKPLTRFSLTD